MKCFDLGVQPCFHCGKNDENIKHCVLHIFRDNADQYTIERCITFLNKGYLYHSHLKAFLEKYYPEKFAKVEKLLILK